MTDDHAPGPTVAVCVPVYNKEEFIAESIESVLKQTFTDFELILLDNASDDRSFDIMKAYDDARILLVRNESTIPATENFNKAVSLSSARYVKVLMADDLIHPDCLERQVAELERDERLAMVTCRQDMIDESGLILAHDRGLRAPDLLGRQERMAVIRRAVRHGGNPIGAPSNVLLRRTAFNAAGGFPTDEPFFTVDVSIWLRLLQHGDYVGMPETLTSVRINSGSDSVSLGREAIRIQRSFARGLRPANPEVVRRRDALYGDLRAPLTRLRHHMLFAAAAPRSSPRSRLALKVMALGGRLPESRRR